LGLLTHTAGFFAVRILERATQESERSLLLVKFMLETIMPSVGCGLASQVASNKIDTAHARVLLQILESAGRALPAEADAIV
jgi:hypothetical protein